MLGVSIKGNAVYVTRRDGDGTLYHRLETGSGIISGENIWDRAGDELKEAYAAAALMALAVPGSRCLAKRIELDDRMNGEKDDYRRWRAGLELPDDPDKFIYGFLPVSRRFDSVKSEMIFYAAPKTEIEKSSASVFAGRAPESCLLIPEQLALTEVLRESISKDDISQAAIVSVDDDGAVAVIMRDNRYHHSRSFEFSGLRKNEFGLDLETYLLSRKTEDEELPLVVLGSTGELKLDWSPVVPVFLGIDKLDYAVSWGVCEFALAGGRCELSAAS